MITFFSEIIYSPDKKQRAKAKSKEQLHFMEAITTLNICDLPSEIIAIIVDLLGNKDYIIHFKETCSLFGKSVSHFYIAGQMVSAKYGVFTTRWLKNEDVCFWDYQRCINVDCYDETENVLTDVWNYGFKRYIHTHQQPLNTTTMIVNGKPYSVKSHYCCECFKNHVLVGSNPNASQHYGEVFDGATDGLQVNVTFNKEPTPSTWTNYRTHQVEPLLVWQVNALNNIYE